MPDPRDDRILRLTRWLSAAVIPFLIAASVLLYLLPEHTDVHFAWTIQPPITAMVLGSAYLGGIWFFVQVLLQRRWHRVRYGFPAVVVFASLLAVATFTHWDRFHAGHVSFITWVVLYATTPVLMLAVAVRNWRADPGEVEPEDAIIPLWQRVLLALIGLAALLTGLALFAFPGVLLGMWAWQLTPLTAQVIGAVLTLPGCVNLWLLADPRWSAFRCIFQAQLVSLVFLAGAVALRWNDLRWEVPAAALFAGGILASLLIYLACYAASARRVHHG